MEKKSDVYLFSTTTEEATNVDFNVEFFEYNPEWYCEGCPIKTVKNFDDLISLLDEWED